MGDLPRESGLGAFLSHQQKITLCLHTSPSGGGGGGDGKKLRKRHRKGCQMRRMAEGRGRKGDIIQRMAEGCGVGVGGVERGGGGFFCEGGLSGLGGEATLGLEQFRSDHVRKVQ